MIALLHVYCLFANHWYWKPKISTFPYSNVFVVRPKTKDTSFETNFVFSLLQKQVCDWIKTCKLLSKYSLCGSNSVQTRIDGSEVGRVKLSPSKVNQSWSLGSQMEEHSWAFVRTGKQYMWKHTSHPPCRDKFSKIYEGQPWNNFLYFNLLNISISDQFFLW